MASCCRCADPLESFSVRCQSYVIPQVWEIRDGREPASGFLYFAAKLWKCSSLRRNSVVASPNFCCQQCKLQDTSRGCVRHTLVARGCQPNSHNSFHSKARTLQLLQHAGGLRRKRSEKKLQYSESPYGHPHLLGCAAHFLTLDPKPQTPNPASPKACSCLELL